MSAPLVDDRPPYYLTAQQFEEPKDFSFEDRYDLNELRKKINKNFSKAAVEWKSSSSEQKGFVKDKSHDCVAYWTRESKSDCDDISTLIKEAYGHSDTNVALEAISCVWEKVDRVAQLAEARTRLLIGKIDTPPRGEAPDWLASQISCLSEASNIGPTANRQAIESVENLVCACLMKQDRNFTAQIAPTPLGHVFVDWDMAPRVLQWEVIPTPLPWPGCRVNVVSMDNSVSKPKIQSRIFHNAFQVIRHFHEQIALR